MNENIDGSLVSLAGEINALEADRKSDNKRNMVAMGHKLIAVRELLRARNGVYLQCQPGLDGSPPMGWGKWVDENLTIKRQHASVCIRYAIHPEKMKLIEARNNFRQRGMPKHHVTAVIRMWPRMDDEQKQRLVNFCFERYNEERTQP